MTDWSTVAGLRNDYAAMVEGLSDDQLDQETMCATWTPRVITGHLVSFVDAGLPSFGEGPAVSGTGEAIMMAMAGRPTLGELSGEGVDEWRERQGA